MILREASFVYFWCELAAVFHDNWRFGLAFASDPGGEESAWVGMPGHPMFLTCMSGSEQMNTLPKTARTWQWAETQKESNHPSIFRCYLSFREGSWWPFSALKGRNWLWPVMHPRWCSSTEVGTNMMRRYWRCIKYTTSTISFVITLKL